MRQLLTNRLGITLVMLADSMELLPKECHLIFNVESRPGFLHTSDGDTTQVDFEYPSRNLLASFAHNLAPLRVKDTAENAAIPSLVSFLDIYGVQDLRSGCLAHVDRESHLRRPALYHRLCRGLPALCAGYLRKVPRPPRPDRRHHRLGQIGHAANLYIVPGTELQPSAGAVHIDRLQGRWHGGRVQKSAPHRGHHRQPAGRSSHQPCSGVAERRNPPP